MDRVNSVLKAKNYYLNRIKRASDPTDVSLVMYEASFDKKLSDEVFYRLDELANVRISNLKSEAIRMSRRDINKIRV